MLSRLFKGGEPERFIVDEQGVQRVRGRDVVESVAWEALVEVRVMTTAEGPFAEDVFFVLDGGDHGCVVPQGLASDELLTRLQALPGFDNEQLIRAMSASEGAEFLCWRRGSPAS